jgi:hypothetical protein
VRTIAWVLLNGRQLAAEAGLPVLLRDARRFARVSLVLASAILLSAFIALYALTNGRLPLLEDSLLPVLPALVSLDQWWGLLLLPVSFLLALRAALLVARGILVMGTDPGERRVRRGRLWRLTHYYAALAPPLTCIAGAVVLLMVGTETSEWLERRAMLVLFTVWCILVPFALALFAGSPIAFIRATAPARGLRVALYLLLLPLVGTAGIISVVFFFNWCVGYLAIAFRSMNA